MELWSAFVIGLVGSVHCAVMCGPIALSLPLSAREKTKALVELLVYNGGRVVAYSVIGIIVGLFGRAIFYTGYQQQLSVALGVAIIASVVLLHRKPNMPVFQGFRLWLNGWFGRLINKSGFTAFFGIGLVNGFLPCGLVYVAIAGAFTQYEILPAALYMAVFGLGTVPMMLGVVIFGRAFFRSVNLKTLTPYLALAMGILFILRGLELNIPYLSPLIEPAVAATCGN